MPFDLDYLLPTSLMGSHTIRAAGLGDRVAEEVQRFNANRQTPAPVETIRHEVDKLATRDMRRVMRPKSFNFQAPGSGGNWIVDVSLRPNGLYLPIDAPDPDGITESKERNRIAESSGSATSRQATGTSGGNKGVSVGVYVTPFAITPVDIGALGARLVGKVSAGWRSRQVNFSANNSHQVQSTEELKGPLHTYRSEMRLEVTLTPPGGPPTPLGPQPLDVDVHVPGGLGGNRRDAPQTITFADPNAPGFDPATRDSPGQGFAGANQTHPIQVSEPTYNPPPHQDGTRSDGHGRKLTEWTNNHLGLKPRPGRDRFRTASTRQDIADQAAQDNANTLATDMFRDNIARTTNGPLPLYVTDKYGRPRTMYVWSFPTRFERQPNPPNVYDLRSVSGTTQGVTSGKSQSSFFRGLLGGGLEISISVLDFIVGRIAPAAVDFTGQISRQHGDGRNQSGSLSSVFWGSPDTVVYRVTRNYYAQFDGETSVHSFHGTTYETTGVDNAKRLKSAENPAPAAPPESPATTTGTPATTSSTNTSEPANVPESANTGTPIATGSGSGSNTTSAAPTPPAQLATETTRPTETTQRGDGTPRQPPNFRKPTSYAWDGGRYLQRPPDGDRAITANEHLIRTVLRDLHDRFAGLVLPDISRDEDNFAIKPGNVDKHWWQRSVRENKPMQRSYDTAVENTQRIIDALSENGLIGNDGDLYGSDGILVPLLESATFKDKVKAIRIFGERGRAQHSGDGDRGVGTESKSSSALGSGKGRGGTLAVTPNISGNFMQGQPDAQGRREAGLFPKLRSTFAFSRNNTKGQVVTESTTNTLQFKGPTDRWTSPSRISVRTYTDDDLGQDFSNRPVDTRGQPLGTPVTLQYAFSTPRLPEGTTIGSPDNEPRPQITDMPGAQAREQITGHGRPGHRPDQMPSVIDRLRNAGAAVTDVNTAFRTGDQEGNQDISLTGATYRQFSRHGIGGRYRWGRGGDGWANGYTHKVRSAVRDSAAGRHFFPNYASPANMTAHLQDGARASTDVSSRLRSPHNLRTTTDTRPDVTSVKTEPVDAEMIVEDTYSPQDRNVSKASTMSASVGGGVMPRINVANDPAAAPADQGQPPGQSGGPNTQGSSQAPTWSSGPQAERTWISSKNDTNAVSRSSGTTILPASPRAYLFQAAGAIKQATEFARNWSIGPTINRSPIYTGWQAASNNVYSGFIHAWGAITHRLVDDGIRVDRDQNGNPTGLSRVPLAPPTPDDPGDVQIRPGFERRGEVQTPPDADPALTDLIDNLAGHHLELTRNSRETLHQVLSSDLANHADSRGQVPVKVRRTTIAGLRPHGLAPAIDAVVDVGVVRSHTRLESAGGEAEIRRKNQVKTTDGRMVGSGVQNSVGVQGRSLMVPTQSSPASDGAGNPPDGARPTPFSMAHENMISSTESSGHNITDIGSNGTQLNLVTPYAQVSQNTDVTLNLTFPDRGLNAWAQVSKTPRQGRIAGHGFGGRSYVTYPAPYLEFRGGDQAGDGADQASPERHPERVNPNRGEALERQWQRWAPQNGPGAGASRSFVEVIEKGGQAVKDLSHVGLAAAGGWRPEQGHVDGNSYTDAGAESARAFLDDKYGRDAYYDGVDDSLTEVAFASSFKDAAGSADGYRPPDVGRTTLSLKARPAGNSRVHDVAYTGAIYGASGEEHGNAAPGTHTSTLNNSGGPSVAAEITATQDGFQRQLTDYNSVETGAMHNSGGTDAPTFAAKGPSTYKSNVSEPLYLVEFDVEWGAFAQQHDRSGNPTGDPFLGTTTTRQTAWVPQQDAIDLGFISDDLAESLQQGRDVLLQPQDDFRAADDALLESRQPLQEAAAQAVREGPGSDAHLRYDGLLDRYNGMVDRYRESLREWRAATNAVRDLLAPPAPPRPDTPTDGTTREAPPEGGQDGGDHPTPPSRPARTEANRPPAEQTPRNHRPPRTRRPAPTPLPTIEEAPEDNPAADGRSPTPTTPVHPESDRQPATEQTPQTHTRPRTARFRPTEPALPTIEETPEDGQEGQDGADRPTPPQGPAQPPARRPANERTPRARRPPRTRQQTPAPLPIIDEAPEQEEQEAQHRPAHQERDHEHGPGTVAEGSRPRGEAEAPAAPAGPDLDARFAAVLNPDHRGAS